MRTGFLLSWFFLLFMKTSSFSAIAPAQVDTLAGRYPARRNFLPLPGSFSLKATSNPLILRVMQFNVLADGLSGLRPDLGGFNRAIEDVLRWDKRKHQVMYEISQYEPDIVTLQEVDHYYDYFLPEMTKRGYTALYARKPTSACLKISSCGDGCAMFVKRDKFRVISCEAKTLALSIAGQDENGELIEDDASIQMQNQVGLIAVCEIINWNPPSQEQSSAAATEARNDADDDNPYAMLNEQYSYQEKPPPVIISTTHLKSSKSATGERYREKGVLQILNDTDKIYQRMAAVDRTPAVLLLGDFNAVPEETDYPPLTYRAVKSHQLGLRSVYNDDVPLGPVPLSCKELYSTWKSRIKNDEEKVTKRCIDYIFYTPYVKGTNTKIVADPRSNAANGGNGGAEGAPIVVYSRSQVLLSAMMRFTVLMLFSIVPAASLISSTLNMFEKAFVVSMSFMSLRIFEVAAEGTIFKPQIAGPFSSSKYVGMSEQKLAEKLYAEQMIRASVGALSNYFIPKPPPSSETGRPGLQPVSALDVFSEGEIGPDFIPSADYPSDHIALASDLQLLW